MGVTKRLGRIAYTLSVSVILAALMWWVPVDQVWQQGELAQPLYILIVLGCAWWVLALVLILNYPRSRRVWSRTRSIVGVFGWLTLVPAWAGMLAIRSLNYAEQPLFGGFAVLFVLLLVWAADVGAYFAGVRYGRNKLMPAVSPVKPWKGF